MMEKRAPLRTVAAYRESAAESPMPKLCCSCGIAREKVDRSQFETKLLQLVGRKTNQK
jgi:hypothetical protein